MKHVQFGKPKSMIQAIALAEEHETFNATRVARSDGRNPEERQIKAIHKGNKDDDDGDIRQSIKQLTEIQKLFGECLMKDRKELTETITTMQGQIMELQRGRLNQAGSQPMLNHLPAPSQFIPGLICDNCFMEGHLERQCQNRRASRPPPTNFLQGVWCFRCRHEGHTDKNCPNPRPPFRSQEILKEA